MQHSDIPPATSGLLNRTHDLVRLAVLTVITVGGVYLCVRLAAPFLYSLVWALTLAVLFSPLQRRLESRLKSPGAAALFIALFIGLVAVLLFVFLAQQLMIQTTKGTEMLEARFQAGEWRHLLATHPRLSHLAETIQQQLDLPGLVKSLATWVSAAAGAIVKGSVYQVLGFGLTFYLLFFFLRDRRAMLQSLRSLSPLAHETTDRLCREVGDTIHATVYGTLAVSLLQGALGGLMFWWLGLPVPLFWGGVMALLALIPVLGAFVVWTPAAFFLLSQGDWEKALILTLWGTLVVGTVDNLLRPVFIGSRLKLHTVLAFLSVVGGLILFGPAGLILGPVVLTITTFLLQSWNDRNAGQPPEFQLAAALARFETDGGQVAGAPEPAR